MNKGFTWVAENFRAISLLSKPEDPLDLIRQSANQRRFALMMYLSRYNARQLEDRGFRLVRIMADNDTREYEWWSVEWDNLKSE